MKSIDYSLYLVTDERENFLEIIEEAIKGGVSVVQLRDKTSSTKDFYELAMKVREICYTADIPLIINDRIDIALAIDADGVHIGQDDMPCKVARRIIGNSRILGVSASTIEEAIKAESDGADYIGTGAVFPTSTKDDAPKITKNDLKSVVESVSIPVVAIGGIDLDNVEKLSETGIEGISVVSAIMDSIDPKLASELLKKEFEKI
ncbi:thiamine phosphate synthase [Methanobrevibacter sp. DSM 116169]|uniref:thiamine phosphate synthase n=1 Tax=Methanobrevibacter sp. DSM 116169 TaxID=3242727 RepID=UPI0038FCFF58